ncbi:MAG: hypothetical protein HC888_01485 [Candidatus Competibacteraceae bacterium]|nr:hypothetical protein [Candidatus Competibacteraceae bacterium]
MPLNDFLSYYWPQLAAAVGFVFWLARLEAAIKAVVKDMDEMKERRKEDRADTERSRAEVLTEIRDLRSDVRNIAIKVGARTHE